MNLPEPSLESPVARDPVEELAEVFLERYRRGERPALSEFTARAPEHADEIRDLFPALVLMEEAVPAFASAVHGIGTPSIERLGDYRIIREIGRGGMGIVYEAEQEALGRHVALKVLPFSVAANPHALLRFRREARSAARLHHTNIVPVFDIGERDGFHYYAMQFIQGQSLDAVITELRALRGKTKKVARSPASVDSSPSVAASLAGSLMSGQFHASEVLRVGEARNEHAKDTQTPATPPASEPKVKETAATSASLSTSDFAAKSDFQFYRSIARIGLQIADALSYAHGQRVLHRDIKPSNLLLDARGIMWVTDFGLAKEEGEDITRTGDVVGTLRYMAPERFTGVADARSDIYSLGLTLYELATLGPAFPETDRVCLVKAIAAQEPKSPRSLDPHLPRDLETIVLKAINKDPAARYAAAEDMEEDLRRFLADRPIHARRTSTWERLRRWCRRNPGWAATIGAVFALLLLIAVGAGVFNLHLQQALKDAQAADVQKNEKLFQAHLERARALRSSGRVGQRFEALKAIREAAKIKITPELRDEAVAALVLPDAAIAREWEGCPEDTLSVAHDAQFDRYARLSKNGEITVCRLSLDGEKVIARLGAHGRPRFLGLWMSPDGRYLACGHSGTNEGVAGSVRIWKLDGATDSFHFDVPEGMHLYSLSFHAKGKLLALGHPDGNVSVYDLETKQVTRRRKFDPVPHTLAFHPRDSRLAVGCKDSVRLWDVDSGRESVMRLTKADGWTHGLAWHPEGRVLAAASEGDGKIHLFDTETGAESMPPLGDPAISGVFMSFSHKGDRLISAGWEKHARLWDVTTGQLLLTMPGHYGRQFSPDDSLIGVERSGTNLRLWRLADGRELRTIRAPYSETGEIILGPVLHSDGRVVAAGSVGGLGFYDLETMSQLAFVRLKPFAATPRTFDAKEGWMTGGRAGVLLWPARPDPTRPDVLHVGPPRLMGAAQDPGCDASSDGSIRATPTHARTHTAVFDRDRPDATMLLGPQEDVRVCAVSPDGKWVASCGWFWDGHTGSVRIWKIDAGKAEYVRELPIEGHAAAGFSPDGKWLATHCERHNETRLWEVETWRAGMRFGGRWCWSDDSRVLAVQDVLGVIRLVQPRDGKEIIRLTGPEAKWYWAKYLARDGTRLIAAAQDNNALFVWDLRLIRKQLQELDMDWEWPEFAPAARSPPVRVVVNPGRLRQPVFASPQHDVAIHNMLLALQPFHADFWFHRGYGHLRLQDWRRALADFEMFLVLASSDDPRRAESVSNLAEICNNIAWEAVAKSAPKSDEVEVALPFARRSVELDPDNFNHHNTLGVTLYRLGQYEEAIRFLEPNVKRSGGYAAFDLYFLAMSHARLGHQARARECLDRANASAKAAKGLSPGQRQELAAFRMEAEAVVRQSAIERDALPPRDLWRLFELRKS